VTALAAASLAAVVAGVIWLASYLPREAPLAPALACLVIAVALLLANAALLARTPAFAWRRFFQVGGWALLAYAVVSGMLEYTFLYDRTRGALLAILSAMLVLFAVNVPLLMAFTVARYERVEA
jgi:hypothetical protein